MTSIYFTHSLSPLLLLFKCKHNSDRLRWWCYTPKRELRKPHFFVVFPFTIFMIMFGKMWCFYSCIHVWIYLWSVPVSFHAPADWFIRFRCETLSPCLSHLDILLVTLSSLLSLCMRLTTQALSAEYINYLFTSCAVARIKMLLLNYSWFLVRLKHFWELLGIFVLWIELVFQMLY